MDATPLKAMRITPSGEISYVDFYVDGKINKFFNEGSECFVLGAGDYVGLKLDVFCSSDMFHYPINRLGSIIVSYLKDTYWVRPYVMHGDIIIVDDDGDMDQAKLDKIYEIIELKKKKVIPDELNQPIVFDETGWKPDTVRLYQSLLVHEIEGRKHYGEKKGDFPSWL